MKSIDAFFQQTAKLSTSIQRAIFTALLGTGLSIGVAEETQAGFIINLQPILVCDTDGSNCADTQATGFSPFFEDASDLIWGQGMLDFNYLSLVQLNDSDSNAVDLDSASDVASALNAASAINDSTSTMVLNVMFVDDLFLSSTPLTLVLGFSCDSACLAGQNTVIINDVIFGNEGPAAILDQIAHQVGHILGLGHDNLGAGASAPDGVGASNLMTADGTRTPAPTLSDIAPNGANLDQLAPAQITVALDNFFVKAVQVPEPSTLTLFVVALGGLGFMARRRLT